METKTQTLMGAYFPKVLKVAIPLAVTLAAFGAGKFQQYRYDISYSIGFYDGFLIGLQQAADEQSKEPEIEHLALACGHLSLARNLIREHPFMQNVGEALGMVVTRKTIQDIYTKDCWEYVR